MPEEKEGQTPPAASLDEVRDRIRTRRVEPDDVDEESTENTDTEPSAPEADTAEEPTLETAGDEDEATPSDEEPTDEESTPAPEEAPESEPEGTPEPSTTEAVEPPPPGEDSAPEDDDPVALEVHGGKTFRRSDLHDDEKFAEFKQELARGYMREDAYTRQRQQDTQQVNAAVAQLQDREALLVELASDPDMGRILSEFGPTTDVVKRLLGNPQAARAILASPAQKERLYERLDSERANPEIRTAREASERASAENATLTQQAEQVRSGQELVHFATTLEQSIQNYQQAYPDVDAQEVGNSILGLVGISLDDFAGTIDPAKVGPALAQLRVMMIGVNPQTGERFIRPEFIEREYERLKYRKAATATAPTAEPATPAAGNGRAAQHNAAVKAKLDQEDDGPPAVPAGESPGVNPKQRKAETLDDVRRRIEARRLEGAEAD